MFFKLNCLNCLDILDINDLLVLFFANIFIHLSGWIFVSTTFLSLLFFCEKIVILIRSRLFIFAFVSFLCRDRSKDTLLQSMSKNALPGFSSGSFMVYGLTRWSLIHFEFIFVCGVRKCPNFILLCSCPGSLVLLIEEEVVSKLYIPAFFAVVELTIQAWVYVWALRSVSLFAPVPFCFDYCSFEHSLTSEIVVSLALFFFLLIAFTIWGLMWCHTNFRTICFSSVHRHFDRDCSKSVVQTF